MTEWIRFSRNNQFGFGVAECETVVSYIVIKGLTCPQIGVPVTELNGRVDH